MSDAEKILLGLAADNEYVCVLCSHDKNGTSEVAWRLHSRGLLEYGYTHRTEPRAFFKITKEGLNAMKDYNAPNKTGD